MQPLAPYINQSIYQSIDQSIDYECPGGQLGPNRQKVQFSEYTITVAKHLKQCVYCRHRVLQVHRCETKIVGAFEPAESDNYLANVDASLQLCVKI